MKSIAAGLVALATMGLATTAKAAWAPRVASGKTALVASVTNGKNAMPAKGGNAALTGDDISAAVDYILSQAK
jgi:cytochrome c5